MLFLNSCGDPIEIQGHRGCRGLKPENSIGAFREALKIGVNTLEMDVVISADGQVVVSHEPWISSEICRDLKGNTIPLDIEKSLNIFKMPYAEVKKYDCGSKVHPRFSEQAKEAATKPLLSEVIQMAEDYCQKNAREATLYNIEIKSQEEWDGLYHPKPGPFTSIVMQVIKGNGIEKRTTVQSFDVRILQEMHKNFPEMTLALLVENEDSPQDNLNKLGFTPQIYSPYFKLVNDELLALCKEKGMRLIPWTVNETADMQNLADQGVDGLITDYPDRAVALFKGK